MEEASLVVIGVEEKVRVRAVDLKRLAVGAPWAKEEVEIEAVEEDPAVEFLAAVVVTGREEEEGLVDEAVDPWTRWEEESWGDYRVTGKCRLF